ncbi:MAG: hypothetical protein ACJAV5_001500 [Vicingaceae bacterium]|jgi:hypothetical protein
MYLNEHKTKIFMNPTTLGVIIAVALFLLLSLIKKDSKYSYLGMNFKRVFCPNCNKRQPFIRKPTNQRQLLNGGYTCENCQTEMDKFGTELKN